MRRKDSENKIYLEKTDLDLSGISAIKISPDELECLTNQHEDAGMKELQKNGIEPMKRVVKGLSITNIIRSKFNEIIYFQVSINKSIRADPNQLDYIFALIIFS